MPILVDHLDCLKIDIVGVARCHFDVDGTTLMVSLASIFDDSRNFSPGTTNGGATEWKDEQTDGETNAI